MHVLGLLLKPVLEMLIEEALPRLFEWIGLLVK